MASVAGSFIGDSTVTQAHQTVEDSHGVQLAVMDANEAVASVAYRMNEVIAIYPITPSSPMGEWADEWATAGAANLWGQVPRVAQMQSEGGAAGAVHGALQAGSLATTFTASQGLLLMVPNLYKIAGELTSFCIHVAARTLATHALSIFCDHSDVMACRQTGFAMLCSSSVQEAQDFACIGQAATLAGRVPVMHFFDGFRTSHEIAKIRTLSDDDLRAVFDESHVAAHRARGLTPDRPVIRGTAQNPDVFFQAREACNPFYDAFADIVQGMMDRFAARTGRAYRLFDYVGHPQAERVIVAMGSGCQTAQETVEALMSRGEKVGLLNVRLYRPFDIRAFLAALPKTVQTLGVLDRTKEPGAIGDPLYLDVVAALHDAAAQGVSPFARQPRVVGGRYGLSSKEFTPAMVKAVFDHLSGDRPMNHFTVGISDDVTHRSIPFDESFTAESDDTYRAVFFGLGADGTVGANKNTIKIIGEETDLNAQGFFVYDSKKSGARTISHLRFGPRPIRSAYLIERANLVACHQFNFLDKYDIVELAAPGGTLLLNTYFPPEQVWDHLPREVQAQIIEKRLRLYAIDAQRVATDAGMGNRINTVMQTAFFAVSKVIDPDQAIACIKHAIRKTYERKGEQVVQRNIAAVDAALSHLHEVNVPARVTATGTRLSLVSTQAPDFVQRVSAVMMAGHGDRLPVSAFLPDGTWPVGTTRWEKRDIATQIPIWDERVCIQCNKCAFVCPHAAIRAAAYEPATLDAAPQGFRSVDYKAPDLRGLKYTIQVAPQDCTGCGMCVEACPAKDKANPRRKAINMLPHLEHVDAERGYYDFFLSIPPVERSRIERVDVKGTQFFEPLFEYSGACAGCGETPYLKLLTQLLGDRLVVANATGCSSIYGGNLPTTPWTTNRDGRGPAWSNSLFEDNAEFGFGMRLAVDQMQHRAQDLLKALAPQVGQVLVDELLATARPSDAQVHRLREQVVALRGKLREIALPAARQLDEIADYLVRKSVWLIGGDGWAYDIGYGGLDHVMASGVDVKMLVLDTEVYSNTGGQASKSTPLGAAAKFAASGKAIHKKDLGLMAISYGHVYVASIAFGANDNQTVKAIQEAEAYPGPAIVIAYSHCIAHGFDLRFGGEQQKKAVQSGVWPLYRYDPRLVLRGEAALHLDSGPLKGSVEDYMAGEARFRMVESIDRQRFKRLARAAKHHAALRMDLYKQLAQMHLTTRVEKKEPAK